MSDRSERDNAPLDDELAELVTELDRSDPLPDRLLHMAEGLYAWHNSDAELLELLVDSAVEALPLARSDPHPRVMAFGDDDRGIHFECHCTEGSFTLRGAVQPPGSQLVVAERIGGTQSTELDSFGLFELGPLEGGRIRLAVRTTEGADIVLTPWFVLQEP
jgi:hypothetical protein